VIAIDSNQVPDLYSIRCQEIGKGIDNKTLNRQLQTPRVNVLFRGVQEQEFLGRIGYVKEEFALGSFRDSLLEFIEFVLENTSPVILGDPCSAVGGGYHCAPCISFQTTGTLCAIAVPNHSASGVKSAQTVWYGAPMCKTAASVAPCCQHWDIAFNRLAVPSARTGA
jgi:hypothetical protein